MPSILSAWRSVSIVLLSSWLIPGQAAEPQAQPPAGQPRSLTVFPTELKLDGPRDEHRLVVLGEYRDNHRWDLTHSAKYSSADSKIAVVDGNGTVRPAGDGQTVIRIEAGDRTMEVPVKVQRAASEDPVSFTREVVPVLTKSGCNQGACHGAQLGRGGFKLSLLGFDPFFDHPQIVQSAEGRRIVLSEPDRSILLLKPMLAMEHQGGKRFEKSSRAHRLLRTWLEDGAPEPRSTDPAVTKLEVFPPRRVLAPGERQQLLVRATWSDGRVEDVTSTALLDALNDSVAAISPAGLITGKVCGDTHIMVRFCGQVAVSQVTLPYAAVSAFPEFPASNFIDEKLFARWKDLGLTPSPPCSDEQFFRRIHLDALGTLPTPESIKAFLADKDPQKRRAAIDRVLERPEFVDFWALKWGDLLRINRDQLADKGMWSFHNWVRASLRDNRPVDEFVRDIIGAEGSTFTDGPANFYQLSNNALDWSEMTTQVFLGVRLQCARCHHHPFEKWSQDDYYGMAAFFVRLGTKRSQEFGIFGQGETVVFLKPAGEINHPRKGNVVPPHPLDGPTLEDRLDRRKKLADWITARENPFFARNIVNRFWGYFMGHGIVEPLDDMRATNPPTNPELLDALAADLVEHRFDLKHLMRTIMNSRSYQLGSAATPGNQADAANTFFARHQVKRLSAEQIADAIDFATGTREKYTGLPLGTRAIQLPDTTVRSYLMDTFGRPARQITCECERTMQPNIAQALHLLNGDFVNKKIAAPKGRIEELLKAKASMPAAIEELYLVTLSRPPRPEEVAKVQGLLANAPSPSEGLQDLLWVLLNSREFQFNH
jgi:hypothetical protein